MAKLEVKGSVVASDAFFPYRRWPDHGGRGGRHGGHPARRIDAQRRGDRGCRRARARHDLHGHAPLPALSLAMPAEPAASAIALRPVTDGDRFLVRRWLREPRRSIAHGAAPRRQKRRSIWPSPAPVRALPPRPQQRATPIGYAHAGDATLWHSRLPPELPVGAWTCTSSSASGRRAAAGPDRPFGGWSPRSWRDLRSRLHCARAHRQRTHRQGLRARRLQLAGDRSRSARTAAVAPPARPPALRRHLGSRVSQPRVIQRIPRRLIAATGNSPNRAPAADGRLVRPAPARVRAYAGNDAHGSAVSHRLRRARQRLAPQAGPREPAPPERRAGRGPGGACSSSTPSCT